MGGQNFFSPGASYAWLFNGQKIDKDLWTPGDHDIANRQSSADASYAEEIGIKTANDQKEIVDLIIDDHSSVSTKYADALPRQPIPNDVIYLMLNEDELQTLRNILSTDMLPDHMEEARIDSVYSFIELYLLPYLEERAEITSEELKSTAYKHLKYFQQRHPKDFIIGFDFLSSVDAAVTQLLIFYTCKAYLSEFDKQVAQLMSKASLELRRITDDDDEILYSS